MRKSNRLSSSVGWKVPLPMHPFMGFKYIVSVSSILKSCTEISESNVAIDVESINVDSDVSEDITLSQINKLENFEWVNLRCKMVNLKPAVEVSSGKQKQNIIIRDSQG